MKKFLSSPSKATIFSIILVSVLAIIINACRKIDIQKNESATAIRSKFFSTPATVNPALKSIMQSIMKQDQQRNFVPRLVKKAGYPVWDKSMVLSLPQNSNSNSPGIEEDSTATQFIYIPFVLQNATTTNAVLAVRIGNTDTSYRLIYGSKYASRF